MQSKLHSRLEALANIATGFGLSYAILFAIPLLHRLPLWQVNLTITVTMTFLSFLRQYSWRRFFNRFQ